LLRGGGGDKPSASVDRIERPTLKVFMHKRRVHLETFNSCDLQISKVLAVG
jgi:hypothetical protein